MHIKTTMRYYFALIRMAVIKNKWAALTDGAQWVGLRLANQKVTRSMSRHMPGVRARSSVGGTQEATGQCFSYTSMFLSLSFPLLEIIGRGETNTQKCQSRVRTQLKGSLGKSQKEKKKHPMWFKNPWGFKRQAGWTLRLMWADLSV